MEKAAEHITEQVDVIIVDPTAKKSSKLLNKKAEVKAGDPSLEISSSSKERVCIATNVGVNTS